MFWRKKRPLSDFAEKRSSRTSRMKPTSFRNRATTILAPLPNAPSAT